ncbi:MAG: toprim domain-containing protein [Deltaproteobacteria bacterium]|nr:toprim domain-containing protein [Deltaproteobacteria bacterium]
MNVLDLAQKKVKLRKVSTTRGGEWQGPCPSCGGRDRFHVWPDQNQGQGSYWCRGCDKKGDAIQYLRDFEGMSFHSACDYLNLEIPNHSTGMGPAQPHPQRHEFTPAQHRPPVELWQEKAEKFTAWAQEHLTRNTKTLEWLAERGIDRAAAERYRLGWNPGEKGKDIYRARVAWGLPQILKENGRPRVLWIPCGLVIPAIIDGIVHRIRIRRPEGEPRYYVVPGSSTHTMCLEPSRRAAVIVESELDALAVVTSNSLAAGVAVGTSHAKPDAESYEQLKSCLQILVALDFDKAGIGAMKWWKEHFDNCDYWPVPDGKDPGDAFRMGIDLEKWIKAGLPPALTIEEGTVPGEDEGKAQGHDPISSPQIGIVSPEVRELYDLLRGNPAVTIINQPGRLTVLRNGKYVGGRINELVFRVPEVMDYILTHPAEKITGENFIK